MARARRQILLRPLLTALLLAQMAAPQEPAPAVGLSSTNKEVLNYAVEWRLINAGSTKLTYTALPQSAGEIRMHLESSGLISRLYRISDDYTSSLGQNFCTVNTFLAAHEGSRSRETRVNYDSRARKAFWQEKDLLKNATATQDVDTAACVHDVIGGLLVLRNLKLEPGQTAAVPISDGKKFADVKIEAQRREDLRTALGLKKTILYEVFLFDNVIYKRSAHLHIWLTDDDQRLPVQVQIRMQFAIGTITLRLTGVDRL